MDYYSFDNNIFRSSTICCELVMKIKQYISILHIEAGRLRGVQHECNELLDKFYQSKNELDSLVKEVLQLKYLGEDDYLSSQTYVEEFTLFIKSVWQMGKSRFLEKGKKTKYMSFVGSPLAEVTSTIVSFVEEIMSRLTYMPYHSECVTTMHSTCNQIIEELKGDCLSSAETCLRQYIYLQAALPFLQELKSLINQYLLSTSVQTLREFLDQIIHQIPSVDGLHFQEDCEDMAPFRFMVEFLTGKLLASDVLDHRSEIKPVVEDDTNFKRSMIVIETVNWIMQQSKTESVPRAFKNFVMPGEEKSVNSEVKNFGSPMRSQNTRLSNLISFDVSDLSNQFESQKSDWSGTGISSTAFHRRVTRRGRRTESNTNATNPSNDLQPIVLHTLQSPILYPLL